MQTKSRKNAARCLLMVSLAAGIGVITANSASAHMGIDLHGAPQTAGKGSVIFFRPGHGCAGDATNTLSVTLPPGVTGAKPQQKAGWDLTSTADTVTWSGGTLPDDQFDDFGLRLTWPKLPAGATSQSFYFKAVQTCEAELKVTKSGQKASITGLLPEHKGQKVDLFVDDVPLTKHGVGIGADGRFTILTSAAKLPEGSQVIAKIKGQQVGNSATGVEAWIEIPTAGSTSTLSSPAPSVLVVA